MIHIQHIQWQRPQEGGNEKSATFIYDAFANPDPQSSIAAVVVRRYANNGTAGAFANISLVENAAANPYAVQAAWKRYGLAGIEYVPYAELTEGLSKLDIEIPPRLTATLVGQEGFHHDAEAAQAHTEERLAHLVFMFRTTSILSESVEICTAFIAVMRDAMPDMHAIYQIARKK